MAEYIDRDKLKYQLKLESCVRRIKTLEDVEKIIDFVPVADVAPVEHGKWIDLRKDDMDFEFKCSICGEVVGMADEDTTPHDVGICYCPNCGAKMDLKE